LLAKIFIRNILCAVYINTNLLSSPKKILHKITTNFFLFTCMHITGSVYTLGALTRGFKTRIVKPGKRSDREKSEKAGGVREQACVVGNNKRRRKQQT
jgi:hypothetical protein